MTGDGNESERVDPSSLSKSENLTNESLSGYDSDFEGEDGWNDTDSKDRDYETERIRELGLTNLKFQLDTAEAGRFLDSC